MRIDGMSIVGKTWLHRVTNKNTHRHRGPKDAGRVIYSRYHGRVYYGGNSDWVLLTTPEGDVLEAGTRILMGQPPIPNGWNIILKDDISVMLTNNSSEVGDETGNWTITGFVSGGAHDDHDINDASSQKQFGSQCIAGFGGCVSTAFHTHIHTLTADPDGLHTHMFDGTWRPQYRKFCEVELQ